MVKEVEQAAEDLLINTLDKVALHAFKKELKYIYLNIHKDYRSSFMCICLQAVS